MTSLVADDAVVSATVMDIDRSHSIIGEILTVLLVDADLGLSLRVEREKLA